MSTKNRGENNEQGLRNARRLGVLERGGRLVDKSSLHATVHVPLCVLFGAQRMQTVVREHSGRAGARGREFESQFGKSEPKRQVQHQNTNGNCGKATQDSAQRLYSIKFCPQQLNFLNSLYAIHVQILFIFFFLSFKFSFYILCKLKKKIFQDCFLFSLFFSTIIIIFLVCYSKKKEEDTI